MALQPSGRPLKNNLNLTVQSFTVDTSACSRLHYTRALYCQPLTTAHAAITRLVYTARRGYSQIRFPTIRESISDAYT